MLCHQTPNAPAENGRTVSDLIWHILGLSWLIGISEITSCSIPEGQCCIACIWPFEGQFRYSTLKLQPNPLEHKIKSVSELFWKVDRVLIHFDYVKSPERIFTGEF